MRMKKIGLLGLALVLALGLTGAAFAHWDDQLYINGIVETGEVLIGFVWQETDDPDEMNDPVNLLQEPICGPSAPYNKHVATTTCELQNPRIHCDNVTAAVHDLLPCHEKIHIDMDNVYPGYAPSVYFDIANCGTIPVVVTDAKIVRLSVKGVWRDVDIPLPKCTPVPVDPDNDGVNELTIGFSMDLDEPDQQIDECETIQYDLHFCFLQELDECTDYDFEIKIHAVQWNKA